MNELEWRRAVRRASMAAFVMGALGALGACGNDLPTVNGQGPAYSPNGAYDCCVDGVYYVCQTKLAYGNCLGTPPDASLCTLQAGRNCPATSNQ